MPGRIKIQGNSLKYIDKNGQVWEFPSSASSTQSSGNNSPGAIYISNGYLQYVTASGQRRRIRSRVQTASSSPYPDGDLRIQNGELRYTVGGRQYRAHAFVDNSHSDYSHRDTHNDQKHSDKYSHWDTWIYGTHTDRPHSDHSYSDNDPRRGHADSHIDEPHRDEPPFNDHLDFPNWNHSDSPHRDSGYSDSRGRHDDYSDVTNFPIRSTW